MSELQQRQTLLTTPDRDNLIAIVSLTEMVVLKPALNAHGCCDQDDHRRRVDQLLQRMKESGQVRMRIALGNFFTGLGRIARSYRTTRTTMMVGKQLIARFDDRLLLYVALQLDEQA